MESFLNQLSECVIVLNKNKEVIFANDEFNKAIGFASIEELKKRVEINDKNIKILFDNKHIEAQCSFNEINFEGEKYYVSTVKVEGEKVSAYTNCKDNEMQAFDIINIINRIDNFEDQIGNNNLVIFDEVKNTFEAYFQSKKFNIWVYDEKLEVLTVHYNNDKSSGFQGYETRIDKNRIEEYLTGNYKPILYTREVCSAHNSNYILRYPIIHCGNFLGLLTISYDEFPNVEMINNELIKRLCSNIAFILQYIDVSKKLREQLKVSEKSKEEMAIFLDTSKGFLIKSDKKYNIVDITRGGLDVLGWNKEDILKMAFSQLIHPDDLEETYKFINEFKNEANEELINLSNRVLCVDGSYKEILWEKVVNKDEDGYMLASGRDITRERQVEERERAVNESIYLERLRSEFFSNVSHEFKTPLTLIMAAVQVIEHYTDDDGLEMSVDLAKKYLKTLKQNSYRLLRLINNIIDVNKLNTGFYKVQPINVNIVEVVEDIVMSVVGYCNHKGINIVFNTDIEEQIMACDPEQVERVMLNLLSNAIKYTENGGDIIVDIKNENKEVIILIEDTGIGMPKENLNTIFDRFVQIEDEESISKSGSGIGLALVKSIVELHNGEIVVDSTEGIGTVFKITLPVTLVEGKKIEVKDCNKEIESKLERYNIEFSDIYSLR